MQLVSFIAYLVAVKGVTTTPMELVDAVRVLRTPGSIAKHILWAKTSFPATKLSTVPSSVHYNNLAALEQAATTAIPLSSDQPTQS
jgi:hypothetical protein